MEEDLHKKSVAELLQTYDTLVLQPNNRIKCKVTGHEMPPQVNAIAQHLQGQKYKKALAWYSHDYSQYQPYIVAHKTDSHKLFCTLTKQDLNKIPKEVEKHVNGKRYLRLKMEAEEKQMKQNQKEEDEDPDCWVPDALSDESDDDINEEVNPTKQTKNRKRKVVEDDSENEDLGNEFDDEDESISEEENEAPVPKNNSKNQSKNSKSKQVLRKKSASIVVAEDDEYIIRSVSKKEAKKMKHKK